MHAQLETIRPVMDLDVERQLRHRMAMAGPTDTVRGMFFNGVLDVAQVLGGSEAVDRCREVSDEKRFIDFFNYPVFDLLRMTLAASNHLGLRAGGAAGVLRRLGTQGAKDFLASAPGKTMLLLTGNNPRRLLNQLPSSYRTAVSFGERRMIWSVGERNGRLVVQRDFMPPAYTKGFLQGMLEAVGARNVSVSGRPTGLLDSEYELTWQ
ncbi:DUF2378 family protein [Hyalangium rubrum]|uniref:DUF2378 family protein n=1 Tax=Hyalangium rubrum TaxID=3103134 RepID=A0ABU5HD59_9BACT|nr:DUF2378 family protein [Hyalangium sp. s54d21]MDY7231396.1 DUF2378 family protein [Hyalangium sp. s54d21]